MTKSPLDLFDEPQPTGDLASLMTMANELVELESQLKEIEQLKKQLSGRAIELKNQLIPDKMTECGLAEFKTPDGNKIKVEDFIYGKLPKEDPARRARAIAIIEEMGGEAIIKNELLLRFEKSQHNEAMALAEDLREKGFYPEVISDIHHGTYSAFVREHLRNGEEVDTEALGIFVGRTTKVELRK